MAPLMAAPVARSNKNDCSGEKLFAGDSIPKPNHGLWPVLLRKSFLSTRTSIMRGDVWRENVSSQETHRDPLTNEPIMIFNKLYCSVIHFLANKKPEENVKTFSLSLLVSPVRSASRLFAALFAHY